MSSKDIVNEIDKIYTFLDDRYKNSFEESEKNFDYVNNNCWDEDVIIKLDKLGKPHLNYNILFSTLNTMVGNEQVSRKKIKFKPQTREDELRADVVSKRWDTLNEEQGIENKLQDVFQSGLIHNHGGWLQWRIDFDDMYNAEFFVEKLNPFDVMPEHSARNYDLSDCNYILKKVWMSLEEIKTKFKNENLKKDNISWWDKLVDYISTNRASINARYYDKLNDKYLLLELQKKVDRNCSIVIVDNKTMLLTDDELSKIKETGQDYTFIARKSGKRIRKTIVAPYFNEAVLYDSDMPYPFPYFDVIPFFTQGFDNDVCNRKSLVSYLTDIQDDINKSKSQFADYVSRLTGRETVVLKTEKDAIKAIEDSAGESNVTYPVTSMGSVQPLNRGVGVPPEIMNRGDSAVMMSDRISQVNSAMRGESERSGETGVLFDAKVNKSAVSINQYFENLSKTRKMIAQVYADLFPYVYFEKNRVINIKEREDFREIVINIETENGQVWDMTNFSKNLIVTESSSTITKMEEEFNKEMFIAQQLLSSGLPVPFHLLLMNSNLTNKEEWIDFVSKAMGIQQQNAQAEQAMTDMERVSAIENQNNAPMV